MCGVNKKDVFHEWRQFILIDFSKVSAPYLKTVIPE
jgi:hypothetical protein